METELDSRHRAARSAERLIRLLELDAPDSILRNELDLLIRRTEAVIEEVNKNG